MKSRCIFVATLLAVAYINAANAQTQSQLYVANEQGLLPYGSYQGGNVDAVDLKNGNLTIRIPLFSIAQRGKLSLSYSLVLNNEAYSTAESCYTADGSCFDYPVRNADIGPDIVMDQAIVLRASNPGPSDPTANLSRVGFAIADSAGGDHQLLLDQSNTNLLHSLDGSAYSWISAAGTQPYNVFEPFGVNGVPNPCEYNTATLMIIPPDGTVMTADGISHTFQPQCVAPIESGTLDEQQAAANGYPAYVISSPITTLQDPEGNNKLSYSTWENETFGVYQGMTYPGPVLDGQGNAIVPSFLQNTETSDVSKCPDLGVADQPAMASRVWTVPGANGQPATYRFCMAEIVYNTDNGVDVSELNAPDPVYFGPIGSEEAIQSVVLPNGQYWGFVYDSSGTLHTKTANGGTVPDPDTTPVAFADLAKLLLPGGGSISYTYTSQVACAIPPQSNRYVKMRTKDDGLGDTAVWNYDFQFTDIASQAFTTVTDPLMNDTVHTFVGPSNIAQSCLYFAETETQQYAGTGTSRTLLKTTDRQFANVGYWPDDVPNSFSSVYNSEPTSVTESINGGTSVTHTYSYPALWTLLDAHCAGSNNPQSCSLPHSLQL
jgi:hypothetical protein